MARWHGVIDRELVAAHTSESKRSGVVAVWLGVAPKWSLSSAQGRGVWEDDAAREDATREVEAAQ
jgi:hypothetical protein